MPGAGVAGGMVVLGGTVPAGTWITVSRNTPPPCTLPRTFVGEVICVRQSWRDGAGRRLQRSTIFCWCWSGEPSFKF
ncbi:hypothetical protein D3C71_1382040 [compost metagenome]